MKTQIITDKQREIAIEEFTSLMEYFPVIVSSQFYFDPINEEWTGVINYYE